MVSVFHRGQVRLIDIIQSQLGLPFSQAPSHISKVILHVLANTELAVVLI